MLLGCQAKVWKRSGRCLHNNHGILSRLAIGLRGETPSRVRVLSRVALDPACGGPWCAHVGLHG